MLLRDSFIAYLSCVPAITPSDGFVLGDVLDALDESVKPLLEEGTS